MPLLKLWKSILGRSEPAGSSAPPADDRNGQQSRVEAVPTAAASPPKPAGRGKGPRLKLFGGGPHAPLRKLVKPLHPRSVLEISVGDGSRAVAVMQALGDAESIRYAAIDQFEMAGGPITLKRFHQLVRAEGIRAHVFPETMEKGLMRVAHTWGAVDLVIISVACEAWQTPQSLAALARVCRPETVVLYLDGESWARYPWPDNQPTRRAA